MVNYQSTQSAVYRKRWEQQRRLLYIKYLEEEQRDRPLHGNHSGTNADPAIWHKVRAFERSLTDASGGDDCVPNIPASCWFFFTGTLMSVSCVIGNDSGS